MSADPRPKNGPTPTAPDPPSLPLGVGGSRTHKIPDPADFESALQHLIHRFMQTRSGSEEAVISGLHRVFVSLGRELGRVDGALRLHGLPREETLRLLRNGLIEGKAVTLSQHEKDCTCEASKVLQDEIEVN